MSVTINITNRKNVSKLRNLLSMQPRFSRVFVHYDTLGFAEEGVISAGDVTKLGFDRNEAIKLFKELDDLNLGKYWIGRRDQPTRIELSISSNDIRKALDSPLPNTSIDNDLTDDDLVFHEFLLRPQLTVKVALPSDFNTKDSERLKKWLDTLPFD